MQTGTLYIVSTPIGNLKDISLRALDVLQEVDIIACEDTRHTGKLTSHYGIKTRLISYYGHKEKVKAEQVLKHLREGSDVALVSDAGTPGISDPGYVVISRAREEEIPVTIIPGASAVIAGLVVSGFPMDRFTFEGFFPHKKGQRRKKLEQLKGSGRTVVFYASPHRLTKTLADIEDVLGDIDIACARELTKMHEEIQRMPVSQLRAHYDTTRPRGEYILIFHP